VNDRELNTDGPSPLESLVRPEERAASDVPQDISPEAILELLESHISHFRKKFSKDKPNELAFFAWMALCRFRGKLRERMDANSMPPG
jgi:hypothetical protein